MVGVRQLFSSPPIGQSAGQIVRWWEARRLHYNAIVFASILLAWAITSRRVIEFDSPWRSAAGSIGMWVLLFMVPANLWYTFGWVVDLGLKRGLRMRWAGFAPWALGAGVVFSILFVVLLILMASAMAGV